MTKTNPKLSRCLLALGCLLPLLSAANAAPAGPTPIIPDGGQGPGPYPNSSVSAANWIARGGNEFNGNVEMDLADNGPIPWSITRYNRGDFAVRLSPLDPVAARSNLRQGFTEVANASAAEAPGQAWTPHRNRGVLLVTARQNGPITWPDGEGPFYPTVAAATGSSGNGYNMVNGNFETGASDINTGKAGAVGEGNFNFATIWFPYDQGWLGGDIAGPGPEGQSQWGEPHSHAAGLAAGFVRWLDFPEGSTVFGGLASVQLPGVNSLEDGMLFTISTDGNSDVNIIGVAPAADGSHWLVTIREDSATGAEELVSSGQSKFEFVYVPFDSQRLVGGHIVGATGAKRKAVGDFTVSRTAVGTYELTIPGKTDAHGALLLQVADYEAGTSTPLASRAFLSYEYSNGRFVIQSRKTTSDSAADLADANFYVAWVDFQSPLAPPDGPRMRSVGPVAVSEEGMNARETMVAASTHAPEVLVTFVDANNLHGFVDPITQQGAINIMLGRFHDAHTMAPTSDIFPIFGNPLAQITKNDVKYNPVTRQYVVVASGRSYNAAGRHVALMALVNSLPAGGGGPEVAKAWVHDPDTEENYDDVAVAVSTRNGNFVLVAERAFPGEGEGTIASLYDKDGNRLTPAFTRVDLLQQIGDEDDPDVVYLPQQDKFLYVSNTDNSNGSDGVLSNRIVGSLIDPVANAQGQLVVRTEQVLSDGLPAGRAEGHPASIENPFNGQLITAYDAGNNTSLGDLSYFNLGTAPGYVFTSARDEVPYLDGPAPGDPFRHQHPQLAADPEAGVIVVGMNAVGSGVGNPNGWAFILLGPDGLALPSQLGGPYYLASSGTGAIDNGANFHTVTYSPVSGSFVVAYGAGGVSSVAGLRITSSHLAAESPSLSIARSGNNIVLTWPDSANGFQLESTTALSSGWQPAGITPTLVGSDYRAEAPIAGQARFFRLRK